VTLAPVLAAPAQPAPASALDEMLKTAAKADVQPAKVASSSEAKAEWQILAGKAEREGTVRRRTFTDITVKPCFAHAPDYAWLVGELLKEGEAWIVHYASVDEEKGDSVLLVNVPEMSAFKDGQVVRVEG
jgi:hypothetical protein